MSQYSHESMPDATFESGIVAAWGKVTFPCGILREKVRHYPLRLEDAVIFARVHTLPINLF